MDEVMALAKNAFADRTLKSYLGVKIKLIPTKKKHTSSFPNTGGLSGYEANVKSSNILYVNFDL